MYIQKTEDSLGRRMKYAPPQASKTRKIRTLLVDADDKYLLGINDFGQLDTSCLFLESGKRGYNGHQKRLCALRNENVVSNGKALGGPVIRYVSGQRHTSRFTNQSVYDLTERGRDYLRKKGYWLFPTRTDHDPHRYFTGATAYGLKAGALADGRTFVGPRQIIAHEKYPEKRRREHYEKGTNPLRVTLDGHDFEPDYLAGVGYNTGRGLAYCFTALEADRSTETDIAIRFKMQAYITIIERGLYQQFWGIPNLYPLFVTTRPGRMQNWMGMLLKLTEHRPALRQYFLFKCVPIFDCEHEWTTPDGPMTDVYTDPLVRAGLPPTSFASISTH